MFGVKQELESWISKIGEYRGLKPHQRVSLLCDYAVLRLIHTLKYAPTSGVFFDELDRMIRKGVKDWLKLPPSATDGVLYAANRDGGLAIPKVSAVIETAKVNSIVRLRKIFVFGCKHLDQVPTNPHRYLSDTSCALERRKETVSWNVDFVDFPQETLRHLLSRCPALHGLIIRRHNRIVDLLASKSIEVGWRVRKEYRCRLESRVTRVPDLILHDGEDGLLSSMWR
ncbi:retrovirus-related Pol polyprotein from type-1 retrotransposable element R2 [Caerostris extrusa]|uniref:Retrovirus-related Pol polyprotein from type-1 retrotransposable element R2 n=1 Tax=Caerostris extrusa TaxID=172846 RepID=A0AAV4PZ59_CAEEX|nr:retrovirus-related Pol polyprotein from type-1 retrotransposable element R2 [Caerostris extrusa]